MGSLRGVFVRVLARLATLGWFRTVEHTGLEHVPDDGPVVVVAIASAPGRSPQPFRPMKLLPTRR